MAEKAANDAARYFLAVHVKYKRCEQVHDDVVVVAGVECDVAAGFGDGAHDVDRPIAIEGSDLDGDDIFDFHKFAPEAVREDAAADGWLQIKSEDGKNLRDGPAVREKSGVR